MTRRRRRVLRRSCRMPRHRRHSPVTARITGGCAPTHPAVIGTLNPMLAVLGASHHDLELTDLAALAAAPADLERRIDALVAAPDSPLQGAVVLATCNRLEVYLDATRFHDAVESVTAAVAEASGIDHATVGEMLRVRVGAPVAAHLFAVTSGLDAMVVGEAEISGQVSRSLRRSHGAGSASTALHLLFQSASRTAKRVSSTTDLGRAGRSVASVALDVVEQSLGKLTDARVVIVGTGAYAKVVVAALRARGCERIAVYSPSGRAEAFAASRGLAAVGAAALEDALADADLVVSASGTGAQALTEEVVRGAVRRRGGRTLPVIDLALRPDVSDAVRTIEGLSVIDLKTAAENGAGHAQSVDQAIGIVLDAAAAFEDELAARTLDPAVIALREHVAGTVQRELDRIRSKVPPEVLADLDLAAHRMTRSLLHTPTVRARALARTGDGEDYLRALHTLFGIDV